jgi:hypothetical protein
MPLSRTHTKPALVAPAPAPDETNPRQLRVEELRRLVARGEYKVSPQKLALRILVKSLGDYSPEKRT